MVWTTTFQSFSDTNLKPFEIVGGQVWRPVSLASGKNPAFFFAWIFLDLFIEGLRREMFKPREPRMFLGILPLYALVMFVLCRNWQEYNSRFPLICKVVLISRVHAISWVFSSIGFRIDVRTIFAFTNSMRFNLWTSGWHVVCRQRPSKNIQDSISIHNLTMKSLNKAKKPSNFRVRKVVK